MTVIKYLQTQGVDIQTKLIPGQENEKDIEFYFFDAGGHPIFRPIIEGIVNRISFPFFLKFPSLKMLNMPYWYLIAQAKHLSSILPKPMKI